MRWQIIGAVLFAVCAYSKAEITDAQRQPLLDPLRFDHLSFLHKPKAEPSIKPSSHLSPPLIEKQALVDISELQAFNENQLAEEFLPESTLRFKQKPPSKVHHKPLVAIIIDDIGYNRKQGMAALALPGEFTYAMLPFTPNATLLAAEAQRQKKEIMLHSPMSALGNHRLSEGALTHNMDRDALHHMLNETLDSLPNIKGVNNHQGSLLTQNSDAMSWVMEVLKERKLYFIDSRTTSKSVAYETANAFNVPSKSRDVFLDHERDPQFIEQQFDYLIRLAKRRGHAVAIGHPYPETLAFLSSQSQRFDRLGVELVPASKIVNYSANSQ